MRVQTETGVPQTSVTRPATHQRLSEQKQRGNTQPLHCQLSSMNSMPNFRLSTQRQKRVMETGKTQNLSTISLMDVGKILRRINPINVAGPDNSLGHILRSCSSELTDAFPSKSFSTHLPLDNLKEEHSDLP